MTDRFEIVFDKLEEAKNDQNSRVSGDFAAYGIDLENELDEIAELRRVVLEVTQPSPELYTTTR